MGRLDLDAAQERYEAALWFDAAGPPETMRAILESVQDVPALVAELRELCLERDQLSRDASDARRQLGIARASVVRLDTELRVAREVVGQMGRNPCYFCGYGPHNLDDPGSGDG